MVQDKNISCVKFDELFVNKYVIYLQSLQEFHFSAEMMNVPNESDLLAYCLDSEKKNY